MMGNDASCKVIGIYSIRLKFHDGIIRELSRVRHVPELKRNLIFLIFLDKVGFMITTESNILKVIKGSIVLMKWVLLMTCMSYKEKPYQALSMLLIIRFKTKHICGIRLGHRNENGLKELEKSRTLREDKINVLEFCEGCIISKSSKTRFKIVVHTTIGTLDYIHTDLWRPLQILTLDKVFFIFNWWLLYDGIGINL